MNKNFKQLVADVLGDIKEIFPWDVEEKLEADINTVILDVREPDEYKGAYIKNSISAPRGILEAACDWGYSDTVPELASAKNKPIIVVCRSGNRSVLAAYTMQLMGYKEVYSLKTGIKGWNDSELPLLNDKGQVVDPDWAEKFLNEPVKPEQML